MAVCRLCGEDDGSKPDYVTFHMCKAGRRSNGQWKPENEIMARRWVEVHTEYEFKEIPDSLQDKLKALAAELLQFTNNSSIMGEVVVEQKEVVEQRELLPWVQKEYDNIVRKELE
jgi:hypothetical protein